MENLRTRLLKSGINNPEKTVAYVPFFSRALGIRRQPN
jgi:hypothetical protein